MRVTALALVAALITAAAAPVSARAPKPNAPSHAAERSNDHKLVAAEREADPPKDKPAPSKGDGGGNKSTDGGTGKGAAGDKSKDTKKDDAKKEDCAYAAEIMVLLGTNDHKGIDSRIGDMPELKKPPFSAYNTYVLLTDPPLASNGKARLALKKDDPQTIKLPNGRVLQVRLLECLPKDYIRMSASINQPPRGKDFLPLLEVKAKAGEKFIVAGQRYKQGMLVLVIRVVK